MGSSVSSCTEVTPSDSSTDSGMSDGGSPHEVHEDRMIGSPVHEC